MHSTRITLLVFLTLASSAFADDWLFGEPKVRDPKFQKSLEAEPLPAGGANLFLMDLGREFNRKQVVWLRTYVDDPSVPYNKYAAARAIICVGRGNAPRTFEECGTTDQELVDLQKRHDQVLVDHGKMEPLPYMKGYKGKTDWAKEEHEQLMKLLRKSVEEQRRQREKEDAEHPPEPEE